MNTRNKKVIGAVAAVVGISMLQGFFWANDVKQLKGMAQQYSENSTKIYQFYNDLMVASRKTDQKQIIEKFNQLHGAKTAISDMLASQYVLTLVDNFSVNPEADEEFKKNHPKEAEESRIKLNEQTQKNIVNTYLINPKDGVAQDRKLFNSFSCSFIDIPCYFVKSDFDKKNNRLVDIMESKVDAHIYDITHLSEYGAWKQKYFKSLTKENREYLPSPGQVEAEKKFKKK